MERTVFLTPIAFHLKKVQARILKQGARGEELQGCFELHPPASQPVPPFRYELALSLCLTSILQSLTTGSCPLGLGFWLWVFDAQALLYTHFTYPTSKRPHFSFRPEEVSVTRQGILELPSGRHSTATLPVPILRTPTRTQHPQPF